MRTTFSVSSRAPSTASRTVWLRCSGSRKSISGWSRATSARPCMASCIGAPQDSRRWVVTSTSPRSCPSSATRSSEKVTGWRTAHCRASTTVLPVTTMVAGSIDSRSRLSRAVAVGARCRVATTPVSRRLASSGNGERRLPVRNPASTCTTGTPARKLASEAANALVVSPCTTTASGRSVSNSRSISRNTLRAIALGVAPWLIRSRSTSGRDREERVHLVEHLAVLAGDHDDRLEVLGLLQRLDDRAPA